MPLTKFYFKLLSRASRSYSVELVRTIRGGTNTLANNLSKFQRENVRTMSRCKSVCGDSGSGGGSGKALTLDTLNPNIIALEYAVRGPLIARALELEKELQKGASKPFKKVIRANLGDAHAMQQCPITFFRHVLACVTCPSLIETGNFPEDVKERACDVLSMCGGRSVGAYTASNGIEGIRKHIAAYIAKRDGYPCDWQNVSLVNGASMGIKNILALFVNPGGGKKTGVMIPIPQYPLYSATMAELGLAPVRYYLDEETNWGLTVEELERSYAEGAKDHNVRALVIINPGNPTGQVLTKENIETIVKFAHKKKLFIFADEVYQHNIYAEGSKFFSFKKVINDMGEPYSKMEVASFMSASKGYMGECGIRGGWMEVANMEPAVQAHLYKALSAMLCPSSFGQIVIDCVVREPLPGSPSYELFQKEKGHVLQSLAQRANMIYETFNKMEGFSCNMVQGAMYAFPQFKLPPKAIEAAEKKKVKPDFFYASCLLEETGICVVPGSGFGQKPGTWHFRTTILPQPELLQEMLQMFQKFHEKFTKEYS